MAGQPRSLLLNNIETWLRYGRWRDPRNLEEGGFVLMLSYWLFGWRPSRAAANARSSQIGPAPLPSVAATAVLRFGDLGPWATRRSRTNGSQLFS